MQSYLLWNPLYIIVYDKWAYAVAIVWRLVLIQSVAGATGNIGKMSYKIFSYRISILYSN